ncbi:hypothetical protein VTP01DRAFT_440 [Rhizomucor pusillus]|uniref:uncharacterized protein n=1 Tax=Rhizomucor pusillus TaxID=4840 RepID=UPI0037444254
MKPQPCTTTKGRHDLFFDEGPKKLLIRSSSSLCAFLKQQQSKYTATLLCSCWVLVDWSILLCIHSIRNRSASKLRVYMGTLWLHSVYLQLQLVF